MSLNKDLIKKMLTILSVKLLLKPSPAPMVAVTSYGSKMKTLLIFIFTILTFEGYSCECITSNLDTLLKQADYAFIGEAVNNISPDSALLDSLDRRGFGSTVEFKVTQIIKGEISDKNVVIDHSLRYTFDLRIK